MGDGIPMMFNLGAASRLSSFATLQRMMLAIVP